ncbi:ricin-type beta-trefoil lectin domain protein [Amycolatopsis sp.]|uniref:ricin-type beta-trefoil lectin domain protein n=1 Tax=Amycolatopsis sp. TaxID=37632 RepID=UPI0039C8684B
MEIGGDTNSTSGAEAGTAPGTRAITWDCTSSANQQWNPNADGTITGVQSGLCLTPPGTPSATGALDQGRLAGLRGRSPDLHRSVPSIPDPDRDRGSTLFE